MSFYTTITPFATTAPTFHHGSSAKRGCDTMDESCQTQEEGRSNKRIKTSASPQPGFYGSPFQSSQPSSFQALIQFTSPSGSTYFTYGVGAAQVKKRQRS